MTEATTTNNNLTSLTKDEKEIIFRSKTLQWRDEALLSYPSSLMDELRAQRRDINNGTQGIYDTREGVPARKCIVPINKQYAHLISEIPRVVNSLPQFDYEPYLETKAGIEPEANYLPPDNEVLSMLRERQLQEGFTRLCQLLGSYFPDSFIEFKLLSGNDDEDDTIIDIRIFDNSSLEIFLDKMHKMIAQLMRENMRKLHNAISLTHWRRNIGGLHGFSGNRTVS